MEKDNDTKPYRPSSSDEGLWFETKYCDNCKHVSTPSPGYEVGRPCDILMRSMFFGLNDNGYPKEWVSINSEPTCTAFKEQGNDTHNTKK